MKNKYLIIIIFSLFPFAVYPQWEWQNPLPQGNDLHSVCFINTQTGFAVGNWGTILKTSDGGTNWQIITGLPRYDFEYIWFLDPMNGWITGEAPFNGGPAIILHTSDGGSTWETQWDAGSTLLGIAFTDPLHGFAVGEASAHLLATSDGGATWIPQQNPLFQNKLWTIQFVNDSTGWVGGNDGIFRTTNGGGSWVKQSNLGIISIFFLNETLGYAAGFNGKILKTTNGGSIWTLLATYSGSNFSRIFFVNNDTGWVIGGYNTSIILITTNGGTDWTQESCGTTKNLYGISFLDDQIGWITGSGGIMLKTENGGLDWIIKSTTLTNGALNRVQFMDENTGYTVGGSAILKTADGGVNWVSKLSDTAHSFNSLNFINSETGWVVGSAVHSSNPFQGAILKTVDGGEHWTEQGNTSMHGLLGCRFVDGNTGWVVGKGAGDETGEIYKTTDGGTSWVLQLSDNLSECTDVSFPDANNGWVVRLRDRLSRTNDGGTIWTTATVGSGQFLYKALLMNHDTGWVTGWYTLAKSVNGGTSWDWQSDMDTYDICFVNADTGWAVGGMFPGGVIKTTDGGESWTFLDCVTGDIPSGVSFIDANTGWVVGPNGTIIKTGDGGGFPLGVEKSPQDLLVKPRLFLYPNPSSYLCSISLTLEHSSPVSLEVFDSQGVIIMKKDLGNKNKGENKFTFNVSEFVGGVYYIKVKTKDNVLSKIFIKY